MASDPQAGDARAGQQVGGRSLLLGLGSRLAEGDAVLAACAVLTLGAAAIHAAVIGDHFEESGLFGTFFVLATLLQLGWAAVVYIAPSRALVVLGAAGNTALILLWILSRTSGLPVGPEPWTREAVGGLDFFASMFEALAVYLSLSLLLRPAPLPRGPLRLSQGTKGLAVTVAFVVGWLVLLSGGGHHSPADDHPATAGSAGGLVTCRCCGSQCSPIGYFAPEAHAAYTALGFDGSPVIRGGVARPDLKAYFASRGP